MKRVLDVILSVMLLAGVFYVSFFRLKQNEVLEVHGEPAADDRIVIVLDPGHGGYDPGKVSKENIYEKDINIAIAIKLAEMLRDAGYEPVLTRNEDISLAGEDAVNRKAEDMRKRCELVEQSGADIVISIHQNSFSDPDVRGGQVFYYKSSVQGRNLAVSIQQAIKDIADSSNTREAKSDNNYYMLLHTTCPTVIVECGFLSNPEEAAMLGNEEYQMKLCKAIKEGVDIYFNR